MPLNRLPRLLLTGWVANPRPLGCPQMNWGRTLKKALRSKDLPTGLVAWRLIANDHARWRQMCGGRCQGKQRPTQTTDKQRGQTSGMAPRLHLDYDPQTLLTQVHLQSAQPVKAGGAAGNKSHDH